MHGVRRRHTLAVGFICIASLVAACTPMPGGTTTTTTTLISEVPDAPVISSFVVVGGVGPAPSLVALRWTVSDPNGDELTCRIDADGDDIDDLVVEDCGGTGSRTFSYETPGPVTARLTVQDSTFDPVIALRPLTVPSGPTETFDIQLRGVEGLTTVQAAAFADAEAYWESTIVRGIADIPIVPRPGCLPSTSPDLPPVVDDLIIDVSIEPIDGPGNILGQAGPTCYRAGSELPLVGIMEFDSADVANLITAGSFEAVILHEMAHVLGIGTLWDLTLFGGVRKVISGAGGPNPVYTGGRAVAEYSALGASGNVPVESLGGPGTRDAHWRETTFGNELLTGFLNPVFNPVSRMTIASLADLGYQITLDTADSYSLPGGMTSLRSTSVELGGTMLRPAPEPV